MIWSKGLERWYFFFGVCVWGIISVRCLGAQLVWELLYIEVSWITKAAWWCCTPGQGLHVESAALGAPAWRRVVYPGVGEGRGLLFACLALWGCQNITPVFVRFGKYSWDKKMVLSAWFTSQGPLFLLDFDPLTPQFLISFQDVLIFFIHLLLPGNHNILI